MRKFLMACAMASVLLWVSPAFALFGLFEGPTQVELKGDTVSLDVSALKPGEAKFYRVEQNGKKVRFFLARDGQGGMHAALDACDVCWKEGKGYKLEGDVMVCVNCGMKFPLSRIGQKKGGCNPHPLTFKEEGNTVVLNTAELLEGARFFPENGS